MTNIRGLTVLDGIMFLHNCKKHETIFASSIISDQWPSRGSWQPRHESLSWLKDHIPTKTLTYFRYLPNIWWHDSQYLGANSSTFKLDHHTWIRCVKVQIQLIIQTLPHFDPIRVINHYLFKVGFPNLEENSSDHCLDPQYFFWSLDQIHNHQSKDIINMREFRLPRLPHGLDCFSVSILSTYLST